MTQIDIKVGGIKFHSPQIHSPCLINMNTQKMKAALKNSSTGNCLLALTVLEFVKFIFGQKIYITKESEKDENFIQDQQDFYLKPAQI